MRAVNAGSNLMIRTDYQGATAEANMALALDPDNAAAKSFRSRVATVSGLSSSGFIRPGLRGVRR